jgi:hypothetical protein
LGRSVSPRPDFVKDLIALRPKAEFIENLSQSPKTNNFVRHASAEK